MNDRDEIASGIDPKSFTIVIPALNEEQSIGDTIARCLAARSGILEATDLEEIQIVAVSDGSTDRTVEIAQGFDEVKTIVFDENRGYGAAIKEGWRQSNSLFLGFLDADGTCDPAYFAEMCRIAVEDSADIVLGSRLGPESKMPRIRRLGNRFYALVLGFFCGRQVSDSASGMRVVRRTCLQYLSPLPDGLHFTPSMSARALLNNLRIIEIPMRYEERIGASKLHVLRDGIQFLRTILGSVLSYRPERFLLLGFSLCALLIVLLAASPTEFYLQNRRLEEWMIYRFVVCFLLGAFGLALLGATALANQMAQFSRRRPDAGMFWPSITAGLFSGIPLFVIMLALLAMSIGFIWPGIVEYATTRQVSLHWSRLTAGAFCLLSMLQMGIFALLIKVVSIWVYQARESDGWDIDDG